MTDGFLLNQSLLLIGLLMFVALVIVTTGGYFIGKKHGKQAAIAVKREKTLGTITGAMLALLGFMLAVSLSMADSNFQARRKLVLDEANAISTSSLRARAIGGEQGAEIVRLLDEYTRLRMDFYAAGNNQNRLKTVYTKTSLLQRRIWDQASSISSVSPTPISALLLASLNEVFDLGTARRWVLEVRIPPYIIKVLLCFTLLSMSMMGYYFGISGAPHPFFAIFLFIAFSVTILLIMDLDRPRSGFIQPEQLPLVWLLEETGQHPPAGVPAR
jgi:CDP-diglyceride synthetase